MILYCYVLKPRHLQPHYSTRVWGHPGADLFNWIAPAPEIPRLKTNDYTICPTCALSKATTRRGKLSKHAYKSPLQLLQVDLCGNFRYRNFVGKQYFITIRDAYSRYYTVMHLNRKSDAAEEFINWVNKTENFFASRGGYEVAAVRTDNGGEFVNSTLHVFFRGKGIEHQMTIPYTSFQNGAVERVHRTIEERTRCLLFGGRVPPSLWTEAVSCVVYLINRLPVSTRLAWEYPLLSLVQYPPSPSSPWTTFAFLDVL